MEKYPSKALEKAVSELSRLPGIGKKTALRLCLHLLRDDELNVENLGNAIIDLKRNSIFCKRCCNIADTDLCEICSSPSRNHSLLCIVQDIRDVMAIENTRQYNGLYHVLNGIINPMEGIGPEQLSIDLLLKNIQQHPPEEIIFALPSSIEGETTGFYLFKLISSSSINISTIARGVAVGDELEYADEVTLGRSIINRLPYGK